jgi:branched-chain amino acid transport system ATP-binding protein
VTPSLETRQLTVRFGGHVAVNAVDCAFHRGTLTSIVGPNGAGKTTYFNLISGQIRASSGSVLLNGSDVSGHSTAWRARQGIGRAFQLTNLFPNLTVSENVRLAVQARARVGLNLWSVWSDQIELIEKSDALLETTALSGRREVRARELAHGEKRKLEIAILMALEPEVFMFDEPTAGMSVDEVPVILDLIRALKARRDKTILLVEHKLDVVRELSDRIIVLHNGALVADGEPAAVMASPIVQEAYLGTAPSAVQ